MRTVDLKENENASDLHVNLMRSCIDEYEQLTDTSIFEVFHFKELLLPWIFSTYGVRYNVYIDDDGDDAVASADITNEKQYAWFLLKHSTYEYL